ncbi:DUF554 domain-containing protein [Caldisalinibacter kiritimatiensis]|uniref:Transport protein n=1 Tax=Caldisalinibacter kiritimatiensis TaxID=1304284 RepID=R1CN85_9FIRM|nr:DUF554 domain-containing protein [Caldisalinibacter kiritimatiensis]EOD00171.1 hypothetical protein L21TH_1822 [Caldisalinibacter kiritimatiensis]
MLGTIVNSIAIIIGGIIGYFLKHGIKDKYKETIMQGLGLTVIVIGLMGALKSENVLLVIISIVIGSVIGEAMSIEYNLDRLGNWIEGKVGKTNTNFSKGFVTASLVYCIGAMAIVGALESGLTGNHQTLFVKSILDGISSIIFASTLGIGVIFSSISVFIYQGMITITASLVKTILVDSVIIEMSAVGGILIMGIGINILEIKKIKIGNMLPAVFIPLIYHVVTLLWIID